MTFNIITLFPETFASTFAQSIIKRSIDRKIISINFVSPRNFAKDKHKTVDDKPYGGGKGMVAKVDVMVETIESIKEDSRKILLCASGKKYSQKTAQKLSGEKSITLICGHYEGVDARVENFVDEVISIGDFVLTGGEIAAMAIVDSVTRLLPGVIKQESAQIESFSRDLSLNTSHSSLLEFPQYTRPQNFRGLKVPKILLLGNHARIEKWRQKESVKRTRKFRPDLIKSKSK